MPATTRLVVERLRHALSQQPRRGAYEFVPNDTAIEALKGDDSVSFTLDRHRQPGATDSETLTINIDGANDTPVLSATLTAATFTDTAGDDSFSAVSGDLSSTDRDAPRHGDLRRSRR